MEEPPPPPAPVQEQEAAPNDGSSKVGSPCEECGEQPWKYRCPGCSRLTCSLPCVQSHKRRAACTGKRARTDPVPLSRFDDTQLLSDYNFLEETKQVRESAHRLIAGFGRNFGGPGGAQLPKWLFFLRKAAYRRRIRLYFLPRGMAKREQNRTRHDHRIDEHTSLLSLLEKHLSPGPWKDQLTPYRNTELHDLKLFIQKSAKEAESPYRQLSIEDPLRPQLRSITIVEYPTINVFLPSVSCDFEVEKIVKKISGNEQPPGSANDSPHVDGTEFHEEEIEEGELAPETQVIDLNECGTSHTTSHAPAVASESRIDKKNISSVLSYVSCLALDGQQEKLDQHRKMTVKTTSGAPNTKSSMKVYPLDMEESGEGGLTSDMQVTYVKGHGASHPSNPVPAQGSITYKTCSKADSLVPSSISILALDGLSGPQDKHDQQSKMVPNTTPEALVSKSCIKVYPLDSDDNQGLLSEVPNQEFEQEIRDAYEEMFGDMNPDDFLNYEVMDEDKSDVINSPFKLWDDLEDGEIPSVSS